MSSCASRFVSVIQLHRFWKTLTWTDISLGNLWFGMAEHPRYSSTYATGVPIALHSAVGRQWICILVDETLNASRGEKQPSDALVRQKKKGYHHLNEALRARNTQFEEAVLALIVIGLEVGWFDNERSRNLHATATDMLIRSRGSPKEALSALTNAEPWYVTAQLAFGICHFSSRRYLDSVKDSWKADFLRILHATKPLCSATINVPWQDRDGPETCAELQARMIKLSVEIGSKSQTQIANGIQLTVLLELALTMIQFADSKEMLMNYFQRLDFLSTGMLIGGGPGKEAYDLRSAAMGPAFSCARRDVISTWYPSVLLDSDTEIFTVHLNALKIFQYLEPQGRCMVMDRLSSWLLEGLPEEGQSLITEAEMAELEEQIVRSWITARKNEKSWW